MVLFKAIQTGACKTYNDLRATANALVKAEAQVAFALEMPPGPTEDEKRLASSFETQADRIALLLRTDICDNQVVAVRKVSPHRSACPREGGGRPGRSVRGDAEGPPADRGRAARGGDPREFHGRLTRGGDGGHRPLDRRFLARKRPKKAGQNRILEGTLAAPSRVDIP